MKNKKLFAILTLVCFMFTLMPVAAFAGADAYVTVNGEEKVTVEVNENVAVAVSTAGSYAFFAVDEDGDLDQVDDATPMSFDAEGTYTVYAADKDAVAKINSQVITKAAKLELLMELDSLVEEAATVKVKANDVDYQVVLDSKEASWKDNGDGTYEITITPTNGWDEDGEITATLQKSVDNKKTWTDVKGAELTFTTAGYVDVVTEDGTTTDRGGDVDFEVVSSKAGEYTVIVKYTSKVKAELTVNVDSGNVANVAAVTVPAAPVNIDDDIEEANIEFKFTDANGAPATAANYKITVVDQPADSDMDGDDFQLVQQKKDPKTGLGEDDLDGVYTLVGKNATYFEEEGTYTIKVTLKSGKSAEATVKVAEQGDIVALQFYKTPVTVVYDGTVKVAPLGMKGVDADGVTSTIARSAVEFSVAGKAVKSFVGADLTAKGDDYIGSEITVYAKYGDIVASHTIKVTDMAAQIVYTDKAAKVAVNNTLYGRVFDDNYGFITLANVVDCDAIVLDKPENAVAVADVAYDSTKGVMLDLLVSAAGEYKVQTVITYKDSADKDAVVRYLTSIDTFTAGADESAFEDVVVISMGANSMIVNNELVKLDVAPFIENNRTMMQFNVLYVFGIDVDWVAETQSIVAEGNGLKVVMNLGSKVAVVNGEEVALDVAPYSVNGRTVVPVGFITGLLDITPVFTYNADGTIADILFTK